jgi:hypothetical protein
MPTWMHMCMCRSGDWRLPCCPGCGGTLWRPVLQVLDWIRMLVDAHFSQLVMGGGRSADVRALLNVRGLWGKGGQGWSDCRVRPASRTRPWGAFWRCVCVCSLPGWGVAFLSRTRSPPPPHTFRVVVQDLQRVTREQAGLCESVETLHGYVAHIVNQGSLPVQPVPDFSVDYLFV